MISAALHGEWLPAEQAVFTVIFVYVLVGKVQELQNDDPPGEKHHSE
jgi:hypothetical protein